MSPYSVENPITLNSSTNSIGLEITSTNARPLISNDIIISQKEKLECPKKKLTLLKPRSLKRNNNKEQQKNTNFCSSNLSNNDKDIIIRERYLNKLGITRTGQSSSLSCPSSNKCQSTPTISRKSALKQSHQSILSKCTNNNKNRRIQFDNKVTIVPVPSRHSYPPDIKSSLWSNPIESKKNLLRNTFEYAYEGRNWRNVIEESNMLSCSITGEKIHPFHTSFIAHNYYHGMTKGNFLLYSKTMAAATDASSPL